MRWGEPRSKLCDLNNQLEWGGVKGAGRWVQAPENSCEVLAQAWLLL